MSQHRAESLDDDKLGGEYPPEEPLGVDEYGTTAAEERWDEPIAERVAREEPDPEVPEDEGTELVAPDAGAGTDTEAQTVADADRPDPDVGTISVDDPVSDDPDLRDVASERSGPPPAEEAAIHLDDEG